MHLDVVDLRDFYYRTKLGRSTQRSLQEAIRALWPDTANLTIAGFGFAAPLLRPFLGDARRVLNLMPGQQGVMHWPPGDANVSILVEEFRWPLSAGTVDRLVVAHGLETCDHSSALLDEIWRVLAPGGRVIFILPNRTGMWARRDATPFGFGRPYSVSQIEAQLRKHRFQTERYSAALYSAPSHKPYWLRSASFWESIGKRFGSKMVAGALVVEASKQIYAKPHSGLREAVKAPLGVLEGLTAPKPKPAANRRESN